MIDYDGRVALADTYPKLLRLNAASMARRSRCAKRISGCGNFLAGKTMKFACVTSRSA